MSTAARRNRRRKAKRGSDRNVPRAERSTAARNAERHLSEMGYDPIDEALAALERRVRDS